MTFCRIRAALEEIGLLDKYLGHFKDKSVDDERIDSCSDDVDLTSTLKLVIPIVGHRMRFQKAFRALPVPTLNAMVSSDDAATNTVQEALALIEEGSKSLSETKDVSDVVLLIGNTGAGKSTIAKLLANPEELECHNAVDRYLIRDKAQKISGDEDTTVSKTIVPELVFEGETNTAIYDLPGFCDTRSESVEIANAFFMKKVADQAKNVKLLCVINHSSVLSGENRTDVKAFLENCVDLIKNPKKFAPAIALVVTKVRGDRHPEDVMAGIAMFLQMARSNLSKTMADHSKRMAAEEILNAILTQEASGEYSRIAYFSEPKTSGPISDLEDVLKERDEISRVLQQNVKFCPSTPDDFGLSVSANAQRLIMKIDDQLKANIAEIFTKIGQSLETIFAAVVEDTPSVNVGTLVKMVSEFVASINLLQERKNVTRKDFIQSFWVIISHLKMADHFSTEARELEQIQEHIKFLEDFSGVKLPFRTLEWTIPILFASTYMKKAVEQKLSTFQDETEAQLRHLARGIDKRLQDKIGDCEEHAKEKSELLRLYTSKIVHLNEALSGATTINEFFQEVRTSATNSGSGIQASILTPLEDDLSFKDTFLNVWQWRKPFEDLQFRLREQGGLHAVQSQNKEEIESLKQKAEEQKKQQDQRMTEMKAEHLRRAKEQDKKLNMEKEEMQDKLSGVKRDFREQQKKHHEEIDRQRKELESKLQAIQSKNRDEIEHLKRTAEKEAKEQMKMIKEMKAKYSKRAKELEDKHKREREEMQKTLQGVDTDCREQQRKHQESIDKQKEELQCQLQALQSKNMVEMENLKYASEVEKMEHNERMKQAESEFFRHAQEQDAKLQRDRDEMQKTIDRASEGYREQQKKHEEDMEQQRLRLEALIMSLLQNAEEKEKIFARKMEIQKEKLEDLKGEQQQEQRRLIEDMNRQRKDDKQRTEAMVKDMRDEHERREIARKQLVTVNDPRGSFRPIRNLAEPITTFLDFILEKLLPKQVHT